MKTTPFYLLVFSLFFVFGCDVVEFQSTDPVGTVNGVRPIYASFENWDEIYSTDPQPIENLGKIYYKDGFIYVNERNKGIHVLDNTNPSSPTPVRFIRVVGSEDIAIKGNILYSDNITDLVAIDISNLEQVIVTSRVKDLYQESKKYFPEGYSGYFECVDPEQGVIVGWEEAVLENPSCSR